MTHIMTNWYWIHLETGFISFVEGGFDFLNERARREGRSRRPSSFKVEFGKIRQGFWFVSGFSGFDESSFGGIETNHTDVLSSNPLIATEVDSGKKRFSFSVFIKRIRNTLTLPNDGILDPSALLQAHPATDDSKKSADDHIECDRSGIACVRRTIWRRRRTWTWTW